MMIFHMLDPLCRLKALLFELLLESSLLFSFLRWVRLMLLFIVVLGVFVGSDPTPLRLEGRWLQSLLCHDAFRLQ